MIDQVRAHEHDEILLWGSIPCTGGTQWTRLNAAKGGRTLELIQYRVRVVLQIWTVFVLVAELVLSFDGTIAIDWPKACTYWTLPRVKRFMSRNIVFRMLILTVVSTV